MFDKKCGSNRERVICILISGVFWYLFAHGYRMANNMFAHDSLLQIVGDDSAWQIALGRFLQPLLLMLRGGISNPWLISVCALVELLAAAYFVTDLLKIDYYPGIFLCLGIMICNPTFVSANASFISWFDFFALALLFSILGVWFWERKTIVYRCIGVCCMVVSMGIYQAYICVSIGLFIILIIEELNEECKFMTALKDALLKCLALVASGAVYYAVWTVVRKSLHIWAANTYNGLDGVLDFDNNGIIGIILLTYKGVINFFWNPNVFYTVIFREQSLSFVWLWILRLANLLAVGVIILGIVAGWKKNKTALWQKLIQCVLLVLLPAGVNFVCILSKGMVHTLMIYAYMLIYMLALKPVMSDKALFRKTFSVIACSVVALCVWSNVVWGNQVYLKINLQDKANSSFITMLVYDIEHTEGFKPGITNVAIAGTIEKSPYIRGIEGFESIYSYGMGKTTTTYMGTEASYIKYHINAPIDLGYVPISDEIAGMPIYPEEGSIRYIEDVLVIRMSEE